MYKFLLNFLPRPLLIRLSYIFKRLAPLLLKGNTVECNVCSKKFSRFLDYGHGNHFRKNVLCPYCLSLERHRLILLYLKKNTHFFTSKHKMLHIAPEQCFYDEFKKLSNIEYITGDLYSPLAEYKFDLHKIPFEDNTFDIIFCNHVLEHVRDDNTCMKELYRVLKPNGFAILQVPIDYSRSKTYEDSSIITPEQREKEYWQKDHVRLYGKDYPNKLSNAGFHVECNEMVFSLSAETINLYRLPAQEIIYIGKK